MNNREFAQVLLCEASELLNEGAQAEAYKARKYEKINNDKKDKEERFKRRYKDGYSVGSKNRSIDGVIEDSQRNTAAHIMTRKIFPTGNPNYGDISSYDWMQAKDAANKHIRRHRKTQNESIAILLTEAALLLNE